MLQFAQAGVARETMTMYEWVPLLACLALVVVGFFL